MAFLLIIANIFSKKTIPPVGQDGRSSKLSVVGFEQLPNLSDNY